LSLEVLNFVASTIATEVPTSKTRFVASSSYESVVPPCISGIGLGSFLDLCKRYSEAEIPDLSSHRELVVFKRSSLESFFFIIYRKLHAARGRGWWRCQWHVHTVRQAAEGGVRGARSLVPETPGDGVRLDLAAEVRRHLRLWPPSRDGGCRVHQAGLPARRRRPLLRQAPFLRCL